MEAIRLPYVSGFNGHPPGFFRVCLIDYWHDIGVLSADFFFFYVRCTEFYLKVVEFYPMPFWFPLIFQDCFFLPVEMSIYNISFFPFLVLCQV